MTRSGIFGRCWTPWREPLIGLRRPSGFCRPGPALLLQPDAQGPPDLTVHLDSYVTTHRQQIIAALENWWDKYAVPLHEIEAERVTATTKLNSFLKDLGYE